MCSKHATLADVGDAVIRRWRQTYNTKADDLGHGYLIHEERATLINLPMSSAE